MSISYNKIVDVSWTFGVQVASSEGEIKDNPLCFQLRIVYEDGNKNKSIVTEMNLNEFYEFLKDLEETKCLMDKMVPMEK